MNDIVSLNQLLNIKEQIKSNSQVHLPDNVILESIIVDKYDVINIKKKLIDLFSFFKSSRYFYDFPVEDSIKISSNLDLRMESFSQRNNSSQVENAVQRFLDKKILTTNIYHSIMNLSYKLTNEEVVYLINTFFVHKSEEDIADLLGFSKTYLQKYKKSCIVKMWIDLEKYCKEDD